jgi:hypothetical protein
MIDALKMANIENTDKYAKLAPLPLAGVGGGFCGNFYNTICAPRNELHNCMTACVHDSL